MLQFKTNDHSQIADSQARVQAGSLRGHTGLGNQVPFPRTVMDDDERRDNMKIALHDDYMRTDVHTLNMI